MEADGRDEQEERYRSEKIGEEPAGQADGLRDEGLVIGQGIGW